ncbi:tetratricopeptide repeat protein [Novosphingobium sp. KCTC 2891]|uniref:tetratricopeptide repeat protein n=1 Tax=Novosphingobium sp. KCTC 2891 TaxID=2989730 RepID=UPI002221EE7B|nr:tetratricopeptide repeat protein [Novosphingobium sp. KCTC 2891]MCW1384172.1 tetratricopeptide repeat protein [Novosphingobium sp. KCTC 2891]
MRYTPAAVALSLLVLVTGSMGSARVSDPIDPRAQMLLETGRAQLSHGEIDGATDSFEAALAVDPGYVGTYLALGDAARKSGLQGKAIHYYREALERDPNNVAAISGEGGALAEKGAVEKARANLARLEGLCGKGCGETEALSAAIARGAVPKVVTAEAITPQPTVEAN